MSIRDSIFKAIEEERLYQEKQWGSDFDDKNTLNDWGMYIIQQVALATKHENFDIEERKSRILKAVTIGVALLERDFATLPPRHYEDMIPNRPIEEE